MDTLLSLRDVSVDFALPGRVVHAARQVSFDVARGEVVAVVGESGSGKSVTAMSLLGLLPSSATVSGSALLAGRDLYGLSPAELRAVRGGEIGMVFQEPMSALNPVFRVGAQLVEAIRVHSREPLAAAKERAHSLLEKVELTDVRRIMRAYPHELSGGQLQRIVIAMAIANDPALVIADEPTTALDVTVQAGILELLRKLGQSILLITHDLGVVSALADRVVVMREGEVVERGTVTELFTEPKTAYTKHLLDSVLTLGSGTTPPASSTVDYAVDITELAVSYPRSHGVRAVDGVSLRIAPGEVVGLVGESGSGKSTISGAITGLIPITAGSVRVGGIDIAGAGRRALKQVRKRIGVVFQDPASSLNPRATIGKSIAEPLALHRFEGDFTARVTELLTAVRLDPGLRDRYPHQLSGGQRQRVGIARALALRPALLIADEPTSALDVSVQASILDLLDTLRAEFGFACLFISHDLAVIERVADRVAVLHKGKLVEEGTTAAILDSPSHPYTQRLIASVPKIGRDLGS
ncbi:ABC transporter ATP-binding protein [Amycolatopsis sp. NPDC059657]|uniref:ABC transporter ATP-binding protein n=1 Tax=Amycolatopsis sp. NPDC059657 TaxID=3346899 RepID=UPI00366AAF49